MTQPHRAARWPRSINDLTDTTLCPACFTPLVSLRCQACTLDLTHPAAAELLSASLQAAQSLTDRATLIGTMWADRQVRATTAPRAVPSPATAVLPLPPVAQPPTAPPSETVSDETIPSLAAASTATQEWKPRRSGVQIALLAVGVSLLSVFAIFFLIYAFLTFGLVFRSFVIAAITGATFAAASILRRKNLTNSAEGIAVFAVILSYLDAYAIRSNNFFGAGESNPALYAGITATLLSVMFIGWHRLSGLRTASIVGWGALAPAAALLANGALTDAANAIQISGTGLVAALVATAQLAFVPRTATPYGERHLPTIVGSLGIIVATLSSLLLDHGWAPYGVAASGILALFLSRALQRETEQPASQPTSRTVESATALALHAWAGAVLSLVGGVWALTTANSSDGAKILVTLSVAVGVALLADVAAHHTRSPAHRPGARAVLWASGAGLLAGAVPLLAHTAAPLLTLLAETVLAPWHMRLSETLPASHPELAGMLGGTALLILLICLLWYGIGFLPRRSALLGWVTLSVITIALGALPVLWMSLLGWALLAGAAVICLRVAPAWLSPHRTALAVTLTVSTVLLSVCGWASRDSWAATLAITVIILGASRPLVSATGRSILLAGQTLALPLAAIAFATQHTFGLTVSSATVTTNSALLLALTGAALLITVALFANTKLTATETRIVFWVAALSSLGALTSVTLTGETFTRTGHLIPPVHAAWIIGALTVSSLLVWLWRAPHSAPEQVVAAFPIAPALAATFGAITNIGSQPLIATQVAPSVAALFTAVLALAAVHRISPRRYLDAGTMSVLGATLIWVALSAPRYGWVVLLLSSVTVLILSLAPDGFIRSAGRRKYGGWVALLLAVSALWTGLNAHPAHSLEAYLLPVSGMLLLISLALWKAERDGTAPAYAAPATLFAALIISLVPLSITAIDGSLSRALVLYSIGVALLVAGLRTPARYRLYRVGVQVAALVTIVIIGVGRPLTIWPDSLEIDGWAFATAALIAVAAFTHHRHGAPREATILGALALTALFVSECTALHPSAYGETRAVALIWAYSAAAVSLHMLQSRKLTPISLGYGALVGAISMWTGAAEIIEMVTLPLAVALLTIGSQTLASTTAARSLPTLGPGLLLLLLPTLMSTTLFTNEEPAPLWRLVGLGLAAIAVLLVGLTRKLQAPFLIGAAVTLIHAVTTFAPQIRAVYESQQWWLWVGLGGILLVTLAIRYEHGIRTLKRAAHSIAELR